MSRLVAYVHSPGRCPAAKRVTGARPRNAEARAGPVDAQAAIEDGLRRIGDGVVENVGFWMEKAALTEAGNKNRVGMRHTITHTHTDTGHDGSV